MAKGGVQHAKMPPPFFSTMKIMGPNQIRTNVSQNFAPLPCNPRPSEPFSDGIRHQVFQHSERAVGGLSGKPQRFRRSLRLSVPCRRPHPMPQRGKGGRIPFGGNRRTPGGKMILKEKNAKRSGRRRREWVRMRNGHDSAVVFSPLHEKRIGLTDLTDGSGVEGIGGKFRQPRLIRAAYPDFKTPCREIRS